MNNEENIIIFMGQSGIKVIDCLKRINQYLSDDSKAEIISVEEKMTENFGGFRENILPAKIPVQYMMWEKSFDQIIVEDLNLNSNSSIFLNFHAVYHHQDNSEIVSPINIERIQKLKGNVKSVIVFIDDILDIYRRLLETDEMYASVMKKDDPFEALTESIYNLLSLLQWRQSEIIVSRIVRRVLGVPMFIVATKHPISMISRLVSYPLKDLDIFYLSHPITAIRKEASETFPTFPAEINFLFEKTQKNPEVILFLPTTIDELIIEEEKKGIFIPKCLPRWPLPYESSQYVSPSLGMRLRNINPLNPLDFDYTNSCKIKLAISAQLRILSDSMTRQITSRDLSMVEQSKNGILIYRPFFPHALSRGVMRELNYNQEIIISNQNGSRKTWVITNDKDFFKNRIWLFFQILKDGVENLEKSHLNHLNELCDLWLQDEEYISLFSDEKQLKDNLSRIRSEIEHALPRLYSFKRRVIGLAESMPVERMTGEMRQRKTTLSSFCDKIIKDDIIAHVPTENYLKISSQEDITDDFLSNIFN